MVSEFLNLQEENPEMQTLGPNELIIQFPDEFCKHGAFKNFQNIKKY